eukprot:gnl/TRDRNA2_/TRDRNA2_69539_c0_seq1.p1 gnl/TRDRNA2_/TRDRNA2_69539_c0~~gnl/TRDRNA2_/TRDRNA2_69539_c0_seq1.p1  ORF type:complete len:230 (+),score=40.41 gnl/TRDRNA2_/TRDRNA2_69539_c0_seq1:2-691(+)
MGDFIAETQELHKLYLERLKDGLDKRCDSLPDITGIFSEPLVSLAAACTPLKLVEAAKVSVEKAKGMTRGKLSVEEAAAVHMYTTNHLYKQLNTALRSDDRCHVKQYFLYLRLLISGLCKIAASTCKLYRGVALDLSKDYKVGTEVTWWALSSCTPDLKVASSFGGGARRTMFVITSTTGVGIRSFSEYKDEDEIIFAPGTQFSVTNVVRKGQLIEISLCELDRPKRVQ